MRRHKVRKIKLPKVSTVKPLNNKNVKLKNKYVKDYKYKHKSYNHKINLSFNVNKELYTWIESKKIGIIFHIFYEDLLDEIIENLESLTFNFDLWIVYPKGSRFEHALTKCKEKLKNLKPYYMSCNNTGKDIGGKLTVLNCIIKGEYDYDYLLFAHDKKSLHIRNEVGGKWRKSLYKGIFNKENVNRIFNGFCNDKAIKMCGPTVREGECNSKEIAVNKKNYPLMKELLSLLFNKKIPHSGAFVAGSMFYVDYNYFKSIFEKINIDNIIKLLESGDVREPSYAHAMERVFGLIVTMNNFKIGNV